MKVSRTLCDPAAHQRPDLVDVSLAQAEMPKIANVFPCTSTFTMRKGAEVR